MLIVVMLTCYFCWEILYQERVILGILKISKTKSTDGKNIAPSSDHLEEVVEEWFEKNRGEILQSLRSGERLNATDMYRRKQDKTDTQKTDIH